MFTDSKNKSFTMGLSVTSQPSEISPVKSGCRNEQNKKAICKYAELCGFMAKSSRGVIQYFILAFSRQSTKFSAFTNNFHFTPN